MNKRINLNIKDRKILYAILAIVLVSVFSLTIAYAALSAVLTITGNAEVTASDWDIHFDNIKVSSGSVAGDAPKITSSTTATFSTTLNMPGEYYEFTIDVVNDGTIDAMIENITKTPTLTASQAKYLKYEITYQNGDSINTQQLVEKNSFVRLKVRVEFRNDLVASDLPTSQETLQLGLQLDYTQSNGSGNTVSNNGRLILSANGNINNIGTIVTIGTEQFYTIGTEGDNVKLLAMYNLNVGNKVTAFDLNTGDITMAPITNPTSLQSSDAIGSRFDENGMPAHFPWIGTVAFATEDKHGTNYSDYSGSLIETYVNDYEVAIESMGVNVESARLITKDELVNTFGCNESEYTCTGSAYPWIYSTSYWSGSAYDNNFVWYVLGIGGFDCYDRCDNDGGTGVRPVIVISKDYFPVENRIMTFTIEGTSYKALEGMTWEEWVESDYSPENAYCSLSFGQELVSVTGKDVKTQEGAYVLPADLIINGYQYKFGTMSEPE